jgi:hypothetical protein
MCCAAISVDPHASAWDRPTASKEVCNILKDLPEFLIPLILPACNLSARKVEP